MRVCRECLTKDEYLGTADLSSLYSTSTTESTIPLLCCFRVLRLNRWKSWRKQSWSKLWCTNVLYVYLLLLSSLSEVWLVAFWTWRYGHICCSAWKVTSHGVRKRWFDVSSQRSWPLTVYRQHGETSMQHLRHNELLKYLKDLRTCSSISIVQDR